MKATLTRTNFWKDGIFGTLTFEGDSAPFCVTLEHAYEQPDGTYAPKLPIGDYVCTRGLHHLHSGPVVTFEVLNVSGHSGILCCHVGNFNDDSEGCVLCGKEVSLDATGRNFVSESKNTFDAFTKKMEGVITYDLTVVNDV